jgi:indolepyruvate ferredoxin oxidoreductase beta subunit
MSPLSRDPLNLIIAGVGGQGNIVASQIIAMAAMREDLIPTIGETYGVSQRGGSVMSHVRITMTELLGPLIPRGHADIVVGFEPLETIKVIKEFAHPQTRVILNPRPVYPIGILAGEEVYPPVSVLTDIARDLVSEIRVVNGTEMAQQAGDIRALNIVMVGSLAGSGWLPMCVESYSVSVDRLFKGNALATNQLAFAMGLHNVIQG